MKKFKKKSNDIDSFSNSAIKHAFRAGMLYSNPEATDEEIELAWKYYCGDIPMPH